MKFILLWFWLLAKKQSGKTIGYNWVVERFVTNEQMCRLLLKDRKVMRSLSMD